jgi:hypothetical protein
MINRLVLFRSRTLSGCEGSTYSKDFYGKTGVIFRFWSVFQFTIRHLPFTIYHLPFTIYYSHPLLLISRKAILSPGDNYITSHSPDYNFCIFHISILKTGGFYVGA